jgi:hypothetical protein
MLLVGILLQQEEYFRPLLGHASGYFDVVDVSQRIVAGTEGENF